MNILILKKVEEMQHPFSIKTLCKLKIEKNFLHQPKGIYTNPTANTRCGGEMLKACLPGSERDKDACYHYFCCNGGLNWMARQGKEVSKMYM